MKLTDDIKRAIKLEVRESPDADLFFEAVFESKDLKRLTEILRNHMGEALKPPGKTVRFPRDVQGIADSVGGVWREQSFYMKKDESGEYICAALWPWQSNPSKTTLKIKKGKLG